MKKAKHSEEADEGGASLVRGKVENDRRMFLSATAQVKQGTMPSLGLACRASRLLAAR